ncbi:TetR/AcrR family transcriptional regulator [Brevibacterium sp. CFH 10365]|uniref:TetR/AcrR family transcriptional regulator n=1 Tax=Brevibacterium sp. CFH 10365 TaxID=2585207 RepID=UPI0012661DF4|nr:TetR/AcrR family transcriptional regulator [Brevibacterium sp. CFH 10365]
MARPNTQAQRREDILQAAISLVEEADLAVLTIPQIADKLGKTSNAIRYYYPDVESLIAELARRSDLRFFENRRTLTATIPDLTDRLGAMMAAGLPTGPDDAEWRVIWMAVLDAGFDLHNREDVRSIYHRQVDLYESLLRDGAQAGTFALQQEARDIAMTLMSMEDYLGYRIVARDPQMSREIALRLMKGYAAVATQAKSL